MAQQHTPGPWVLVEHSWSDTSVYSDEREKRICTLSIGGEATEQTQRALEAVMAADAAVIAAAPEMLDALIEVELFVEVPECNCSCHLCAPCSDCVQYATLRETMTRVKAVLAKAQSKEVA